MVGELKWGSWLRVAPFHGGQGRGNFLPRTLAFLGDDGEAQLWGIRLCSERAQVTTGFPHPVPALYTDKGVQGYQGVLTGPVGVRLRPVASGPTLAFQEPPTASLRILAVCSAGLLLHVESGP